jgi:large subunit GTPase 1
MPRNQGTSRKGKPGKQDRAAGMGKALQRAQKNPRGPKASLGGMSMQSGVESFGMEPIKDTTKSVLELQNVDDFLIQADLANREFMSEREGVVVMDPTSHAYAGPPRVQWADKNSASFVSQELSVPRRPPWDETTTPQELDVMERQTFLDWRRGIATKEDELMRTNSITSVTPFEKNIEVWRQLWRVLERSTCLLQLVDARNPLFYLSDDLKAYAKSLGKPMMVLINKSDYLSRAQRKLWHEYLTERGWDPIFFSAWKEQQKLDAAAFELRRAEEQANDQRLHEEDIVADVESREDPDSDDNDSETFDRGDDDDAESYSPHEDELQLPEDLSTDGCGVDVPLSREQLMETMMNFAQEHGCQPDERSGNIQFGMVGFPNVGKSSVINVLVGSSKHSHGIVRVGVASQPGKTKHFQTLFLPDRDDMMLVDCPGLVFPSFVSNTADLIAAGVYPISQMRDHWPVINLICQRIPREIINAQYGIALPVPSTLDMRERGLTQLPIPTADEFLTTYCVARGMLAASSGVPDYTRGARMIIKDYAAGKLLYCHAPPNVVDLTNFSNETIETALKSAEKLRKKLIKQQHASELRREASSKDKYENPELFDDNMLELLGDQIPKKAQRQPKQNEKQHKKHKKIKPGKSRDHDPYGCHATPDDQLREAFTSADGVVVKAGKNSHAGYTRPATYVVGTASVKSNT